ncbi:MAG TPA: hypothetical protein VHE30_14355 [Polyangiaceae bacterium]|nr:hypothetical protein [Polyangiaceae bacterium]
MRPPAFVLLLLLTAPGCKKAGGDDLGSIELHVDGKTVSLSKGEASFHPGTDGNHKLSLFSHDGELNRLVVELESGAPSVAEWVGKPVQGLDYAEQNPEKKKLGVNRDINRFRDGSKYYEGYHVAGTVRSATDAEVRVDLDSVFLEFSDTDEGDEATGREVPVKGSMRLPLTVR